MAPSCRSSRLRRGGLPEAVGPGGLCIPADAPLPVWLRAFSGIWDDLVRYRQLCEAARQYSQRREISGDAIVDSFLALLKRALRQRAATAAK
jgi:hypothetical protein